MTTHRYRITLSFDIDTEQVFPHNAKKEAAELLSRYLKRGDYDMFKIRKLFNTTRDLDNITTLVSDDNHELYANN